MGTRLVPVPPDVEIGDGVSARFDVGSWSTTRLRGGVLLASDEDDDLLVALETAQVDLAAGDEAVEQDGTPR
jgi:hypothetical protein